MTDAGKKRKLRIVDKLFYTREKTDIQFNFYISVLPLFKSFILVFEQKEPLVHRLHDDLKELVRSFLACFLKVEKIKSISSKRLCKLDVKDRSNQKPINAWFIGNSTNQIISKLRSDDPIKTDFYERLRKAYEIGAEYIQNKFPLKNELLKLLSSIDPKCHGDSVAATMMKKLCSHFPTVILQDEVDKYELEVDRFHLDTQQTCINEDGSTKRLDEWWSLVFDSNKYPTLSKLIKAALSIFTGPMIEQSFR